MFGGDADHYAWEKIISKTKESGKDKSESALQWDLYLSTHHCSWSFFNDTPQEDNSDPKKHSLEFLDYKRDNSAKIVASCKEILDNTDNPPHFKAKSQYVKKVTSDNFLHTEKYNVVSDTPQPIIFEISKDGPVFPGEKSSSVKSNASEGFAPKAQWTW